MIMAAWKEIVFIFFRLVLDFFSNLIKLSICVTCIVFTHVYKRFVAENLTYIADVQNLTLDKSVVLKYLYRSY